MATAVESPIRCDRCSKLLCENMVGGFFKATCPRCHKVVIVDRRAKVL